MGIPYPSCGKPTMTVPKAVKYNAVALFERGESLSPGIQPISNSRGGCGDPSVHTSRQGLGGKVFWQSVACSRQMKNHPMVGNPSGGFHYLGKSLDHKREHPPIDNQTALLEFV